MNKRIQTVTEYFNAGIWAKNDLNVENIRYTQALDKWVKYLNNPDVDIQNVIYNINAYIQGIVTIDILLNKSQID